MSPLYDKLLILPSNFHFFTFSSDYLGKLVPPGSQVIHYSGLGCQQVGFGLDFKGPKSNPILKFRTQTRIYTEIILFKLDSKPIYQT